MAHPDFTSYKALSFDCYGTLIDWETGLLRALSPLANLLPASHPFARDPSLAMKRFSIISNELEVEQPALPYSENLAQTMGRLAAEAGVQVPEGEGGAEWRDAVARVKSAPGGWLPFPDTLEGLKVLKRYYKLVILSNIDEDNIARTTELLSASRGGADFDAVYTADGQIAAPY